MKYLLGLLFLISNVFAYESQGEKEDLLYTVKLMGRGGLAQFKEENNLYYAAAATPSLWYAFNEDKRHARHFQRKKLHKHEEIVSDVGIALNFPILPISLYYISKGSGNNKLLNFSIEYFSTLYLTLIETGLLSYIPVHERPSNVNVSFWETKFRGDSSFPSGHIIPYTTLFFKTLQYYGPIYAIIPGVLSYWSSFQRMQEGRHYLSDIIGGIFLTAFASEGVRAAHTYDKNDPFYKLIFEHDLKVSLISDTDRYGLRVSFNY